MSMLSVCCRCGKTIPKLSAGSYAISPSKSVDPLCTNCFDFFSHKLKCVCDVPALDAYYEKCPQHGDSKYRLSVCVMCCQVKPAFKVSDHVCGPCAQQKLKSPAKIISDDGQSTLSWTPADGLTVESLTISKDPWVLVPALSVEWDEPQATPLADIHKAVDQMSKSYGQSVQKQVEAIKIMQKQLLQMKQEKLFQMKQEIDTDECHTLDQKKLKHAGPRSECRVNRCLALKAGESAAS